MENIVFHRSERLLLRPIWPEDWEGIKAGIADLEVLRNLASAPNPYTDEDARRFARSSTPALHPRFLIVLPEAGAVVGTIGLDACADSDGEIGYWIARQYWGRGYATEAGRAVVAIARTLGFRRVTAAHFIDNPASGKVLSKIGFTPMGTQRLRHSMGRGEEALATEYEFELCEVGARVRCAA